jgi:hypothetical protein
MDDVPDTWVECGQMMEGILLAACEGSREGDRTYQTLRQHFLRNETLKPLLPDFVRTNRDLGAFWPFIKSRFPKWEQRRQFVRQAFTPLFDHLEGTQRAPVDDVANEVLSKFDPDGVRAVWEKALTRRLTDPEGAITSARTLLETVCKRILVNSQIEYDDAADLPALYRATSTSLNLAPSQHTEDVFKRILGGATNVVENLGSLRNKIGDAHGKGRPVAVQPRHAQLAVNLAGTIATFLVETWTETKASYKSVIVSGASGLKVEAAGRTQAEADRNAQAKLEEEQEAWEKRRLT